jgi:glycerol uptake facilitator-like aquaporin
MTTSKLARLLAELVGTFVLSAVVLAVGKTYGTPIFTTIAGATTLAALVAVLGPVSGGHFNPAITLGMFSVRRISLLKAVMYVAVQGVGAVLAWKLFEWFSPDRPVTLGATEFDWKVFTAEMIGTAVFAMGVYAAVVRRHVGGQLAATVGMALFAGSLAMSVVIVGRQIVSGVLNPAVALSIGFRPENQSYLAYFFGPVVGAVVGMNLYKMFFSDDKPAAARVASAPVVAVAAPARRTNAKKVVRKTARKTTARRTTARRTSR